jgi:hypothetical protein
LLPMTAHLFWSVLRLTLWISCVLLFWYPIILSGFYLPFLQWLAQAISFLLGFCWASWHPSNMPPQRPSLLSHIQLPYVIFPSNLTLIVLCAGMDLHLVSATWVASSVLLCTCRYLCALENFVLWDVF